MQKKKFHTLCFDGASKGNPREVGMGGILYDPGGKKPQATIGIWG
jgi:ribonuclease HI